PSRRPDKAFTPHPASQYQNTRDGAEDAQDDLVPSIQDDGCESGACKI
ncbi:hypothetical protein ACUOA8_33245, partial [Escherichia sp. SS-MK2]